ncbi:MAG: DUF1501 domain-containing protein, partial [Planctomycetales bacterium]|nr:DUF1501 domain-containing protein [Planctomycetales bacterium]
LNNDWVPNGGMENFGSAYLPATHQATLLRAKGAPVDNIAPADPASVQALKLAALARENADFAEAAADAQAIRAAIGNYETAFRMQAILPQLADVANEPRHVQASYGIGSSDPHQNYYAIQALRARRLVEAGVRLVTVDCRWWDTHVEGIDSMRNGFLPRWDQCYPALINDLERRGLLDRVMVVAWGEFGRTPVVNATNGRDHYPNVFSAALAGGPVQGGRVVGASDSKGALPLDNPKTPQDVLATIYHHMGIDTTKQYRDFSGRPIPILPFGEPIHELM